MHGPDLETELDRADSVWNRFNYSRWTREEVFADPVPDLSGELNRCMLEDVL
jgi:hypothetical protein